MADSDGASDGATTDEGVFSRLLARILPGRGADDEGKGGLEDYDYSLLPKKRDTVIRVARSDPHQDELARTLEVGAEELWAMIARRDAEEERTDAEMPVRLFAGGRVSGVVGIVPRGLEAPADAAIVRLTENGKPPRIPARITSTRRGLRVELLVGATR